MLVNSFDMQWPSMQQPSMQNTHACENLRVAPCASHAAGQWNHRSSSSTPWSGFLVCSALKYLNLGQLVWCMSFAQSSEVGNQCLPVVQGWLIGGSHAVMLSHTRNVRVLGVNLSQRLQDPAAADFDMALV